MQATSMSIEVEADDSAMIRVIDNGCDLIHDDTMLAFERHATSKLRTSDDLLAIATLGFRGEDLAFDRLGFTAAARNLRGETSKAPRIEFAGKLLSVKPAGLPVGTSVSVADLFVAYPRAGNF